MKAEDLMFGDLLTFDECVNDEAFTVIKVTGILEDTLFAQIDGDTGNDELDYEGLVGIPLTQEILEKNRFEYMGNNNYDYDKGSGLLIRYNNWDKRLRIIRDLDIIYDSGNYANIEVHTFQHALKLCGIDLEIKL